jgi:tRNA pseudouridine55 synthase
MQHDFYNGEILLINKPYTWTSFQAVNKIKHAIRNHPSLLVNGIKTKPRIGHAGTLDPLATGLLIVCTGKKTKQIEQFMGLEKEYTGTLMLGATTPCYDLEKPVDQTFPTSHITVNMIAEAAASLSGVQMQVPPIFSAVMINGRRAYEIAREGGDATIKPREVHIKEFEITRIALPEIDFRIVCSKGTYIRSIARDFGLALESGAHLTKLCRTRIGEYSLSQALTPNDFVALLQGENPDHASSGQE